MNLMVLWMMWHCYFLLALFLSSNATNCRRPELCTSSLAIAPIAMTDVTFTLYCNNTHVEVWWTWNSSCLSDIYLKYRCFSLDGEEVIAIHEYQSIMSRYSLYIWNQNVSTTVGQPVTCEVAGYHVMADDECHEVFSPRNITCSVQPTSSETITKQTENFSTQNITSIFRSDRETGKLSGTRTIIVITTACVIVMLLIVMIILVINLFPQKRSNPTLFFDEQVEVFEPGYFPVTPGERLNTADNLSLRSNIQPLETTYFIISDITLAETNVDENHISFRSCIRKKYLYGNEEYDMVSRTTEILDEP